LIDLAPVLVIDAVRDQQASLINPPVTMVELLAVFERLSLTETVLELRRLLNVNPGADG
jgi:ABC-type long-subunit fatty acid transport system fused permease/ATPase subunit